MFLFRRRARLFFNYDYYCKLLFSSGGVRGYLLLLRLLFSGGVHNYFSLLLPSRVLFCRVVCAVIFNYYYCFANCVCFGWRARLFLILLLSRVSLFGWCTRLFFNYYYCHEFCFPGGVRGYFLSSTSIASFVLFRVVCADLFLSFKYIFEFFFSGGVHGFLISITITNVVCPGGVRGYF